MNKQIPISKDEKSTRHLYFDGKKMVMTDTNEVGTFHAGKEFPADSIESFSSKLLKDYGYQPPMTEFFSEDPYKLLLEDVKSGSVAGEEDVDGVPCKKLSLAQEGLSWDLWLSEKDGLPRKLVITFLEIDGSPKYEALISSWELNPDVSKVNFTWEAPETAIELGIIPAEPTEEAPAEQIKK